MPFFHPFTFFFLSFDAVRNEITKEQDLVFYFRIGMRTEDYIQCSLVKINQRKGVDTKAIVTYKEK